VGADEGLIHQVFGKEQRSENVVRFPFVIMAESELGVVGPHLVHLISADEGDVVDAVLAEGSHGPVEKATPPDLRKTLGRIGSGWHQPTSSTRPNDNRSHNNCSPLIVAAGHDIPQNTRGYRCTEGPARPHV